MVRLDKTNTNWEIIGDYVGYDASFDSVYILGNVGTSGGVSNESYIVPAGTTDSGNLFGRQYAYLDQMDGNLATAVGYGFEFSYARQTAFTTTEAQLNRYVDKTSLGTITNLYLNTYVSESTAGTTTNLVGDYFKNATGGNAPTNSYVADYGSEWLENGSVKVKSGATPYYIPLSSTSSGLTFAQPTLSTSGTDDYGISLTQTLNNNAAGGSDVYRAWKTSLTFTDITGWDEVYLADFLVGGSSALNFEYDGGDIWIASATGGINFGLGSNLMTFEFESDGSNGVTAQLYHYSASPADGDVVGVWQSSGVDDADNDTHYGEIATEIQDPANGSEEGIVRHYVLQGAGAKTEYMRLDGTDGIQSVVFGTSVIATPENITSTSEGVAASLTTVNTNITTNGDSDLDNVTLANGTVGQLKVFAIKAVGNVADSVKITPATMAGGTQITFAANPLGLGCVMEYTSAGWVVVGNNGGVIA